MVPNFGHQSEGGVNFGKQLFEALVLGGELLPQLLFAGAEGVGFAAAFGGEAAEFCHAFEGGGANALAPLRFGSPGRGAGSRIGKRRGPEILLRFRAVELLLQVSVATAFPVEFRTDLLMPADKGTA